MLVWGKDTSIGQHTQTIWQLSAGDEKLIPALIMNILSDMAVSISYLAHTQFQESIPPPPSPPPTQPVRTYRLSQ
jgi:hypothetical protein